jgi:hypothetical protein
MTSVVVACRMSACPRADPRTCVEEVGDDQVDAARADLVAALQQAGVARHHRHGRRAPVARHHLQRRSAITVRQPA